MYTRTETVEARISLTDLQWNLVYKVLDFRHLGDNQVDEEDRRKTIAKCLGVSASDRTNSSSIFRDARYLNNRCLSKADVATPFLHYLFSEIGEASLHKAFGGMTTAEAAAVHAAMDEHWYLHQYADVEESGVDAFVHYMIEGWRDGRDPSPDFSTTGYLERYPDIAASDSNPFVHWVHHGRVEGRDASAPSQGLETLGSDERAMVEKLFDPVYYQSISRSTQDNAGALLDDYLQAGWKLGLEPTRAFNGRRYAAFHQTRRNPFLHYLFETCGLDLLKTSLDAISPSALATIRERFDDNWYLYCYPDIASSGQDPFIHYMCIGWTERRDPAPDFSTGAYLYRYPDIAKCGMNPYHHWVLHGIGEGRAGSSVVHNMRNRPYRPRVSAVMVETGDGRAYESTFRSVVDQTYGDLDIVLVGSSLGDPMAASLRERAPHRSIVVRNVALAEGSEDPIDAWRAGADATAADIVWFVSAALVYAPNYVEKAVSSFADNSVQIVFGRRSALKEPLESLRFDELDEFKQAAGWNRHLTRLACDWFCDPARPGEEVARHDTFMWRRSSLPADRWTAAATDGAGQFHLFLEMAAGGQVAWVRDAIALAVVGRVDKGMVGARRANAMRGFIQALRRTWGVPRSALDYYQRSLFPSRGGSPVLEPRNNGGGAPGSVDQLLSIERSKIHVLLLSHGIFAGGAENFPIQLANALRQQGLLVSLLIFNTKEINMEMRRTIDPSIAIFEAEFVAEYGADAFVRDAGFTIVHSHGVVGEKHFFDAWNVSLPIPYVATLHGSYENSSPADLPDVLIAKFAENVDHFAYTAEKNLLRLAKHDIHPSRLSKVINAMPIDPAAFPLSRKDMGIAEEAVVFTLVARGVPEKGWENAIHAFVAIRDANPKRAVHLCLVGEGDETDRLSDLYGSDPSISFLGYQLRIHGLYRISDVAIVPTRFSGESYPLCIIQAMQCSIPIIAADIGDIAGMLVRDGLKGGLLIPATPDNRRFTSRLAKAMSALLVDDVRRRLGRDAAAISARYDMGDLTSHYVALYRDLQRSGRTRIEPHAGAPVEAEHPTRLSRLLDRLRRAPALAKRHGRPS